MRDTSVTKSFFKMGIMGKIMLPLKGPIAAAR